MLLVLVYGFRVAASMSHSKWFQALESAGAHLALWPVPAAANVSSITRCAQAEAWNELEGLGLALCGMIARTPPRV